MSLSQEAGVKCSLLKKYHLQEALEEMKEYLCSVCGSGYDSAATQVFENLNPNQCPRILLCQFYNNALCPLNKDPCSKSLSRKAWNGACNSSDSGDELACCKNLPTNYKYACLPGLTGKKQTLYVYLMFVTLSKGEDSHFQFFQGCFCKTDINKCALVHKRSTRRLRRQSQRLQLFSRPRLA